MQTRQLLELAKNPVIALKSSAKVQQLMKKGARWPLVITGLPWTILSLASVSGA